MPERLPSFFEFGSLLVFSIADRARLIRTRYFSQPAFRRLPRLRSGQAQAATSPSTGSGHAFDYASKGGKNAPAQAPREARPWSTQSSGLFPMISDLRTPPPAVPPRATTPQPRMPYAPSQPPRRHPSPSEGSTSPVEIVVNAVIGSRLFQGRYPLCFLRPS